MTHELMFDHDELMLARLRDLALRFPGAREKISHGRPAFFTTRVFAYFGGAVRAEGEWAQHPLSVIVRADTAEQDVLRGMTKAFVPAYLGMSGWTGVDLSDDSDWTLVAELVEDSYRLTAPSTLVAELDRSRPGW